MPIRLLAARTAAVLNFPNCTRIVITYTYFLTISCIGSVVEMKLVEMFLAKVLRFCTGSEYPPHLGFDNPITVRFGY